MEHNLLIAVSFFLLSFCCAWFMLSKRNVKVKQEDKELNSLIDADFYFLQKKENDLWERRKGNLERLGALSTKFEGVKQEPPKSES